MKYIFSNLSFLFLLSLFVACEKEVDLKLPADTANKLVVEGSIENGKPPLVILTNSFGFFSKIDLGTLQNAFVHGADVKVSNASRTITLREYTIDTGTQFSFSFYSIDTADPSSFTFIGEEDALYKLTINHDGKTYESTTKIPQVKPLDSVWTVAPDQPPTNNPDVVQLFVKYSDPDTFGNAVRYFTQRNSEPFYPGLGSVYDDQIINGTTLNVSLGAGQAPGTSMNPDSSGFFYKGDTITIRWCAIEQPVHNFWATFEYAVGTVGNPFVSPVNVKGNLSNGALGVWAGYGASYVTHIVPK